MDNHPTTRTHMNSHNSPMGNHPMGSHNSPMDNRLTINRQHTHRHSMVHHHMALHPHLVMRRHSSLRSRTAGYGSPWALSVVSFCLAASAALWSLDLLAKESNKP